MNSAAGTEVEARIDSLEKQKQAFDKHLDDELALIDKQDASVDSLQRNSQKERLKNVKRVRYQPLLIQSIMQ